MASQTSNQQTVQTMTPSQWIRLILIYLLIPLMLLVCGGNLGWWPAWKALRMAGAPNIGNGPLKDRREGGITDRSKRIGRPYITVYNEVPYIRTLDRKKRIVARATSRQFQFLKRAVEREYSRIMRSKSG